MTLVHFTAGAVFVFLPYGDISSFHHGVVPGSLEIFLWLWAIGTFGDLAGAPATEAVCSSVVQHRQSSPLSILETMNTSHENLYDKLNNVHASLRKEKEDAHRTKQLAEQRLQLARADLEAAEKRGVETRTQLQKLKTRTMDMKASNAVVETENKQLEKEVRCCMRVCDVYSFLQFHSLIFQKSFCPS